MPRDGARQIFSKSGLKYSDITRDDLNVLSDLLTKHLKLHKKMLPLRMSKKIKIKYNSDGTLSDCYLFVNGNYFTRREAISFNKEGFIGFAGWACETNAEPFTDSFKEWVEVLRLRHRSTAILRRSR